MSFILKLLVHTLISAGVLWLVDSYLFTNSFAITGEGIERYAIVALLFGILNVFVKPVLKLLLLPVRVLTLGLAGLAVNGILLAIVAFVLNAAEAPVAMEVESWVTYVFVGIVISLANAVVHWFN